MSIHSEDIKVQNGLAYSHGRMHITTPEQPDCCMPPRNRTFNSTISTLLASCLIYAGHFRHTHCNCRSFGCILLLKHIYLTTMYRSTVPLIGVILEGYEGYAYPPLFEVGVYRSPHFLRAVTRSEAIVSPSGNTLETSAGGSSYVM